MADTGTVFDVVVLGGGSAGYATALRAAELGLTVALVEADKLGGTCLHSGCIPTKALLHAAQVADDARAAAHVGVRATFDGIDMDGVNRYKDGVVSGLYRGLQGLVRSRGITIVEGRGTLVAPDAVEVDGTRYTGASIVLATGSFARTLPGLTVEGAVVTSDQALTTDRVPASAVVLGGGVIGAEFASVWRSFGAEVTVVEALEHLVPTEDEALSKALERAFRKRGIDVVLGDGVAGVTQDGSGVHVRLVSGASLDAETLLVAVGRGPRTTDLGLEEQGVTLERGFVVVDENLRTGVGNVYAAGDVVAGLQLAHRGFAQGIFVAEHIAGLDPAPVVESGIPRVTYSDPEVASVGLSQRVAEELHGADAVETVEYNLAGNGKSKILGTSGFVKLVRRKDGPVLGVHMVGARVGELVGEGQLVVNWEAYPEDVAGLVHAHPTQDEALGEAFLALSGKPLHAHN
ncbi:dihydrolipoyl dehydrogenase [Cellulomonas sp. PhB143]|uniref:dihydrolipoyl dehydrogenase n=1 Tax=Cellulomonas sp. PhB143 TaxID=2485186 RepID=UPI000F4877DD|nr:dihydrolipoamide dehydrogenase [Cellulomonas sp. PhB143]